MTNLSSALLDPLLRADPAGPRITYYDDATGERIEVSAVTLGNWAAKTANLLRDELGAGPGSRVAVLLPAHWQTAGVFFGGSGRTNGDRFLIFDDGLTIAEFCIGIPD